MAAPGGKSAPDPVDDIRRPELIESISARRFDTALLKNPTISETGETVQTDEGPGQLARIPLLEGISWNISTNLVLRNPRQPREYFDEGKMQELEQTIGHNGQQDDIHVIPIRLQSGEIKLFILDGERRFRVMKDRLAFEHIKAKIRFVNNFWELFAKSFMVNESRAPQTAIERANVFRYLLDNPHPELQRKLTVAELAQRLGTTTTNIYTHIRFLDLDPEIQRLVITDKLPSTSALHLAAVAANLGSKLDQAKLARRLLSTISGNETAKIKDLTGPIRQLTHDEVVQATDELLHESGHGEDAEKIRADKAALRVTGIAGRVVFSAGEITKIPPAKMINAFRDRPTPPEAVADDIRKAIAALTAALQIVEAAIQPPPIPEVPGKPKFTDYIKEHLDIFGTGTRKAMMQLFAKHSDTDQQPLTSSEIAEALGLDTPTIAGNYRLLMPELEKIGLTLHKIAVRQLDDHDEYTKVPAYRIEWILNEEEEKVLPGLAEEAAAATATGRAEEARNKALRELGANRRSSDDTVITDESNIPTPPSIEGKGKYIDAITQNKDKLAEKKLATLLVLTEAADKSAQPLSALEISLQIKDSNSTAIANQMRYFKKDLTALGMEIQQFTFLRKNTTGENVKVTCYRLVWIPVAATPAAAAPAPKATLSTPPPAPKPTPPPAPPTPKPTPPKPTPPTPAPAPKPAAPVAPPKPKSPDTVPGQILNINFFKGMVGKTVTFKISPTSRLIIPPELIPATARDGETIKCNVVRATFDQKEVGISLGGITITITKDNELRDLHILASKGDHAPAATVPKATPPAAPKLPATNPPPATSKAAAPSTPSTAAKTAEASKEKFETFITSKAKEFPVKLHYDIAAALAWAQDDGPQSTFSSKDLPSFIGGSVGDIRQAISAVTRQLKDIGIILKVSNDANEVLSLSWDPNYKPSPEGKTLSPQEHIKRLETKAFPTTEALKKAIREAIINNLTDDNIGGISKDSVRKIHNALLRIQSEPHYTDTEFQKLFKNLDTGLEELLRSKSHKQILAPEGLGKFFTNLETL